MFGEEKIKEHNNMTHLTALQTKNRHKYLAPFANSDAHEVGDRFTILFVKEKSASNIIAAIKEGLTCAVFKRENYEHQFIGKDELAQYVYFLMKEYYPKHNTLKSRLAKLYIDQLINGEKFDRKTQIVQQRLESHTNSFFNINIEPVFKTSAFNFRYKWADYHSLEQLPFIDLPSVTAYCILLCLKTSSIQGNPT